MTVPWLLGLSLTCVGQLAAIQDHSRLSGGIKSCCPHKSWNCQFSTTVLSVQLDNGMQSTRLTWWSNATHRWWIHQDWVEHPLETLTKRFSPAVKILLQKVWEDWDDPAYQVEMADRTSRYTDTEIVSTQLHGFSDASLFCCCISSSHRGQHQISLVMSKTKVAPCSKTWTLVSLSSVHFLST